MASPTVRQILADTRKMIATKQAEIAGQAPSSMPGAEHDSAVPAETKKPDSETRDGTMVPNSGLSTAGAGDDSPKTRGHALEADEAAETPEKKPAVTADANAKTAADQSAGLANEILSLVRTAQKTAAAPAPKQEPAAAKTAAAAPKAPAVADKTTAAPAQKQGGVLQMELTTDVMAKVAALVLGTEEGAVMVEQILEKVAGAEMMKETLDFLAGQAQLAEKEAAFQDGQREALALMQQRIYQQGLADGAQKTAADLFFKMGQDMADASMADMMGGGAGGDPTGAAAAGAAPADDGSGGAPAGLPQAAGDAGGDGQISVDEAMQILQQLVDSGSLQPEEAQTIADMLTGGGGDAGAGDAGAAEAAPAEGGEAPASEGAEGGESTDESGADDKSASAKAGAATSLLAAIQAVRKARG